MSGKAILAGLALWACWLSSASALTVVTDTYTLSGDNEYGSFTHVVASGTWGYKYYSNGIDYFFENIVVTESFNPSPTLTYNLSQNCNTLTPHCGFNNFPLSQYPGASSFHVGLTVDLYALYGNSSVVPTSFSDFVFDASGYGTVTYSANDPCGAGSLDLGHDAGRIRGSRLRGAPIRTSGGFGDSRLRPASVHASFAAATSPSVT